MLVDAAAYFGAVRTAMRKAHRSIFIIGWDLDSRTRLIGESSAEDGWPVTLREFLVRLVEERPDLTVYLLAWDFAVLYALEREPFPSVKLGWNTPDRIRFRLDNELPLGASHHQKIVVIDDALAFSGGLDLTIRRWDTSGHDIANAQRVDPAGEPYRPFHDVQMSVDGPAAHALAQLAHARWERATGERIPVDPSGDSWLDLAPDFEDVDTAIARTVPEYGEQTEIREVEALFCDMVAAAERTIYIENQYLTVAPFAQALAARLKAKPCLQVLMVVPNTPDTWLESHTMRNGRIRFRRILESADVLDRVRLVYPEVRDRARVTHTTVHSKVMIVDDRWLRVGSANLNHRSMGTDTECDLVIEANDEIQRAAIAFARARLVADHTGVSVEQAMDALSVSILHAADNLGANGHRLVRVGDGAPDEGELAEYIESLADPERPIEKSVVSKWFGRAVPRQRTRAWMSWIKLAALPLCVLALAIAWQFPPLSLIAAPEQLGPMLQALAYEPWAALLVIGVYIVGGLIAFPVMLLIAATAAAFGPLLGFTYAMTGALASAAIGYLVGDSLGRTVLRAVLGPRLRRVQRRIVRGGVIAIAVIRMVPIAPFTVVNLVAGASGIRFGSFVAGTILGMLPGLLVMSALGHQLTRMLSGPSAADIVWLVCAVGAWVALAGGVQLIFSKIGRQL